MALIRVDDGVRLWYEEAGQGNALVFVHEFAGDGQSWRPQVAYFARRYRTVVYNARGYPPSDVPEDPAAYSQARAVEDLRALLDGIGIDRAHVCGLSMGGYTTLHFGLTYPERAVSLVVAGAGYGSGADREQFRRDSEANARELEEVGMANFAARYAQGPARIQFRDKDPVGWREFAERLARGSARGHALTLRGIQMARPSLYELGPRLATLAVPTLIITGDEDEPCLEPALFLKRTMPGAGLLVLPRSGHTINLEEPEAFNRAVLDFLTAVDVGRWPPRNPLSRPAAGGRSPAGVARP